MSFKAETKWIGGKYPGALPAHLSHHVDIERRIRARLMRPSNRSKFSPTKDLVIKVVRAHGPVSIAQISGLIGKSQKVVYSKISKLEDVQQVTKELRKNLHNNQSSFFYSGVQ